MKDKGTIINELVDNAARIMEMKAEYNQLVIDQMVNDPNRTETVDVLRETNKRIQDAVVVMQEYSGCWN